MRGHVDGVVEGHDAAVAEESPRGGERFVVHGHVERVRGEVGPQGSAHLHRAQRLARARASAVSLDELTERHAERELHDATAGDIAGQLEDLRAARPLHAQRLVGGGAVGHDAGHGGEGEHVIDEGRLAEEALEGGNRGLGSHHAALALEALEHRRLFAAHVRSRTLDDTDVEGATGAHDIGTEPAVDARDVDRGAQDGNGIGILGAHVDQALRRPRGKSRDGHPLEEGEGVALHEHAIRERAAVTLVGVAAHVLLISLCLEDGAPLDAGGETGSPAATQAGREHVGDDLL